MNVKSASVPLSSVPLPEELPSCQESAEEWAIDTDLSLTGRVKRHWLERKGESLLVLEETADGRALVIEVPIAGVEGARTVSGVGCGLLQIKQGGAWIDLLGFSNALAERFHKIAQRIENEVNPRSTASFPSSPEPSTDASLDLRRCPRCQLRLGREQDTCPRCLPRGQILARMGDLLRPHWKGSCAVVVLTILGIVAELVPPKLQQYMVDHLLTRHTPLADVSVEKALLLVVLALALSRVMLSIVAVIKGRVSSLIGSGITCSLRKEMVNKLHHMSIAYFDRHEAGSLISRVAHDSEVLHGLMHQLTGGFLLQIGQLVGVGAMLVWLNPKLALFTLIPVPLVFLGTWIFWKKVYPRYYRLWDASSRQMTALSGMLSGIRVVKAFAGEQREAKRFGSAAEYLRDWRTWVDYANARYSAAMQVVFSLGGLIVWYIGGRDVIGSEMTLGELIAFLAYLAMFYAPLGALSSFTTWLTSFLSGSKRVMELLDSPSTMREPANPAVWENPRGEIEFDQVTFGYDSHEPVLREVCFRVAPGEMIGIVGRSGSGKTTLVNLLGRFYDPQEGSIRIDGIDVRDLSLADLRQRLGVVLQESFLFRDTIWNNLAYGRPETPIEEALARAKAAGAHDFICHKTLAYETHLGERGAGLSGGEKQRLSIARTLLYDPKILVLDEATSSIDAESEKTIQEALSVLIRGRTTVAIAHRLSTLRNADRIIVLDKGRIAECGTHAELLDQDGIYARLVRIQTNVSKDPNVDKLLVHAEEESKKEKPADHSPWLPLCWLQPGEANFFLRGNQLFVSLPGQDGAEAKPVFFIRAFPATHPEKYLSVRAWQAGGDDLELGMINDLSAWPEETRNLVRDALARRYLLRKILRVHGLSLSHGYLDFDVETADGRGTFTMRWTSACVTDFGQRGKLLTDTDGNRHMVEDVDALPPADRERFLRYVYW